MILWAAAALLTAVIAAGLIRAAMRGGGGASTAERSRAVYKAQLAEIEQDLARGVLTEADAQALRTEVSRRILGTEKQQDTAGQGPRGPLLALMAVLLVAGGGGIYAMLGAPGLGDQPLAKRLAEAAQRYADRPGQAEVEAMLDERGQAPEAQSPAPPEAQTELIRQLRDVLGERPNDLRGHRLLADSLARLGQWREAARAQADVLRILGDDATAQDFIDRAEFLILAVNGYVSPEAEAALTRGIALSPTDPRGRYYSGLGALQAGRADLTYDIWTRLLREGPPGAPWVQAIQSQMPEVANALGRPVPQIPGAEPPSGPSAADMEAASEMTAEERDAMIRGMVEGLAEELGTEGGPPEKWAQLVRALVGIGARLRNVEAEDDGRSLGMGGVVANRLFLGPRATHEMSGRNAAQSKGADSCG